MKIVPVPFPCGYISNRAKGIKDTNGSTMLVVRANESNFADVLPSEEILQVMKIKGYHTISYSTT